MFSRRKRSSSHHQVCLQLRDSIFGIGLYMRDATKMHFSARANADNLTLTYLAALHRRVSIRAIRRQPCLSQLPTILEQPLVRCRRSSAAESHAHPDARGGCADQAHDATARLDPVAGEPDAESPFSELRPAAAKEQLELDDRKDVP